MTKYTNNEQYEKDRLKIIARHSILKDMGIDIIDLLKQSKWIGSGDDDNSTSVLPIPVKKDGNGKLTKNYSLRDWFSHLDEELTEVKMAAVDRSSLTMYEIIQADNQIWINHIADELQDLITVCTSYLDFLGFDKQKRIELTKQINDKNRMRGYFEED